MSDTLQPKIIATPDDVSRINNQIAIERAATVLYSIFAAFQVCLSGYTLIRFRRLKKEHQQIRRRYVYFLLVILCVSLVRFTLYLRENIPRYSPDLWKNSVVYDSARELAVSFGLTAVLSLLGDAFLVWRTTIIWSHKRIIQCTPIVLYLIYFGICLASTTFRFRALTELIEETQAYMRRRGDPRWTILHLETIDRTQSVYQVWCGIEFAMSAVVNVVTTTLICIRLILLERKMKRVAAASDTFRATLPYRQVLTLVLESALPCTLVAVAGAIMAGFLDPSKSTSTGALYGFPLMTVLWTNALALGPQFIIFRIISGTTWTSSPTTHFTRPISQPILFSDDPVVTLITAYDSDDFEQQGSLQPSKSQDDAPGLRPRHGSDKSITVVIGQGGIHTV
ncbi:hypothetical protein BKA70DRAFT_1521345 [Coprinopsis sp. MPI-PUGE-AT-0042]|nr:hypothetical protein BKA70DRAFT_1521345 [Coprinopsis sp. MPI-PUGE-AT-0042]